MEINISKIIEEKLAQMDAEGTVKKKIEETTEKVVLDAITNELDSWSFKKSIGEQVKASISSLAEDCGLSAYNGFIVNHVKNIVSSLVSDDITKKLQDAMDGIFVKKYENVKLSDIFNRYRQFVLEQTDEEDKYDRGTFTCDLEEKEDGAFTHYTCRFADHELEKGVFGYSEDEDVKIRFCTYSENKTNISSVFLDGNRLDNCLRIGTLNDFEAFVVNLYFNKTDIIIDAENVDTDNSFDIDC